MRVRNLSLHCALALAALSGLAPTSALAQSAGTADRPAFLAAIASMPLKRALGQFTAQTGLRFVYASQLVEGVQSPGAPAGLAADASLRRLLEGTGLSYRYLSATTITLLKAEANPSDSARERTQRATDAPSAAADATTLGELVVTGTNIRDVAPTGAPLFVIDAEDIARSGYSGTEQLLQALPQNFRGGQAGAIADVNMSIGGQRGFNATAGSGVNLRGLGTTATLVLINGRRIAATSAGTFTDISLIPIDAIERIEILTDGASAIYGADAVAGVVNIILKRDYDSAESKLSYGSTTERGREETRVSHSIGRRWDSGGLMLSAEYLRQSALMADEREATAEVLHPTSIFPSNTLKTVVFSANQSLSETLTLSTDMQYSHAKRHLIATDLNRSDNFGKPIRRNALVSLEYLAPRDWLFAVDGFVSDEDSKNKEVSFTETGAIESSYNQHRTQDQRGGEIRANGPVLELPAGAMKVAIGATYKEEKYRRTLDRFNLDQRLKRSNDSLFAELHVPIVAEANATAAVRQLDMTLALRRDNYSDFGSSTNPRVGLSWSPTSTLRLRSSYSTSFRAPSIGEEMRFGELGIFALDVAPYFTPDGSGFVPVVTLLGSEELGPEESENWTFGIDWKPEFAPGLNFGMTYYDIAYSDRIILPPFDMGALGNPELQQFVRYYDSPEQVRALVQAYIDQGAFFDDYTDGMFGPDPLGQVTATYSYLFMNAERVDVRGYDVLVDYRFERGENQFELGLNGNYLLEMLNRVSAEAPPYDLVGTFANPPKLRARGSLAWYRQQWSGSLNVNYAHSYTDTSGAVDRPVDAYTTVDGVLSYAFAPDAGAFTDGLSISLAIINLFDEPPPHVGFGGRGANYDAANASPLGRMVSLQLGKRW